MNSKSISLSGTQAGDVTVPAQRRHFGQVTPCLAIRFVEEAKLDAFSDTREQRKIYAVTIVVGA
jgi:hypothetical protein